MYCFVRFFIHHKSLTMSCRICCAIPANWILIKLMALIIGTSRPWCRDFSKCVKDTGLVIFSFVREPPQPTLYTFSHLYSPSHMFPPLPRSHVHLGKANERPSYSFEINQPFLTFLRLVVIREDEIRRQTRRWREWTTIRYKRNQKPFQSRDQFITIPFPAFL